MPDNHTQLCKLAYVLLLLGILTGGLTALVAVVIAHLYAPQTDDPVRAHFRFQYRTFWIGLLYSAICIVLAIVGIGFLLMIAVLVWFVIRCIKGIQLISRNEPVANVDTWLV